MIDLAFARANGRWLLGGFLLAFASSFGQTWFIALFSGEIRETFGLSHAGFGGLYTVATVASAASLIWLGKLADRFSPAGLGALVMAALAAVALAMAAAPGPAVLVVVLFGLRFLGQGMLSHLSMTAMGRWFRSHRARAVSLAGLGYPVGEMLLPSLVVLATLALGWRGAWVAAAGVLVLLLIPAVLWLLKVEPVAVRPVRPEAVRPEAGAATEELLEERGKSRPEVLRDPLFWLLLPGTLAPPFILTGVFFHQVQLVEAKGWTLAWFAACYPAYSLATVATSLSAGVLADRFGAFRVLPLYLLPMAAGLLVLAAGGSILTVPVFMALAGVTSGAGLTVLGALWAELYGTRHLGSIRALAVSAMVFATALAPGLMGWLIDAGVPLERQFVVMALYAAGAAGLFFALTPRLRAARAAA